MSQKCEKEQDSLISVCTSGYETLKTDTQNSESSEKEPNSLTSFVDNDKIETQTSECTKEHDSLTSIGESSGYDSFRYRADEQEEGDGFAEENFWKYTEVGECIQEYDSEIPVSRCWRSSAETIIGKCFIFITYLRFAFKSRDLAMSFIS